MFAHHRSTYFGLADADLPADGVVTGEGAVFGRPVHVASQDFTVAGGSAGEVHSHKVVAMMQASLKTGTPVHLHQRLRRGPGPGGHRVALGLRPGVLQQRAALRGRPADLDHRRAVRRRRRLLAGAHRLHHPDAQVHDVHHRAERDRPGDRRAGHRRGPRRRGLAHDALRGHPLRRRRRPAGDPRRPEAAQLPAAEQHRGPARRGSQPPGRARSGARRHRPGRRQEGLRRARGDRAHRRLVGLPRGPGRLRPEHRRRLRPDHRADRGHRGQPADGLLRGPGHQRLRQGRRRSCASATRSTSRW